MKVRLGSGIWRVSRHAMFAIVLAGFALTACHGQYAVNIANERNQPLVAQTSDGLRIEIPSCATRQAAMAYAAGQSWKIVVYDAIGHVVYQSEQNLPGAKDAGVLIFTVTIPAVSGSPCPKN